jgi:uncharacterized repeat protein (TIGR01451 family)
MLKKRIATATVLICLLGLARLAMAQDNSNQFRPFNGLFADLFDDGSHPQRPQQPAQSSSTNNYNSAGTAKLQRTPTRAPAPSMASQPDGDILGPPPASTQRSRSSATGSNFSFQYDDGASASGPALLPPAPSISSSESVVLPRSAGAASSGLPLHERLKAFRQSPFGDTAPAVPAEMNPPVAAAPAELPANPPAGTAIAQHAPMAVAPQTESLPAPPASAPPAELPRNTTPSAEPQRLATAKPTNEATAKPTNEAAQEPSVLIDHKSPLLTVETIGPRKIVVGKEATYEVVLQNSGDIAAEEVTVTVGLPDWAEVAGTSVSTGEIRAGELGHRDPCHWVLKRIEARSKEKLALKIIPRQSKPFELAVRWDFKQVASQAMIEVQEPKLVMHLDGPREVLFGKREVYKLRLSNSGNGPAENVVLTLMPPGASDTQPTTHRMGTINPSDERAIEIELTARQAGSLTIRVEANGDGGAHVQLAEPVLVHRAGLQVEVEGPSVQYVGTPANYKILVRNPGDAAAKNIKLTAKLPTGMKFISGSDGAKTEPIAEGGRVRWTVDQLAAGEKRVLDMKCTLALSGANRVEVSSSADDELLAQSETTTRAEAMADLRLEVKDPEGPVPVGSDATYELHVRNRGTKAAENVEVLAYFSTGVEPTSADGQTHHISPGQVVFDRIPAIPPAAELVLTVKAKAGMAGNHVFRAELHCKPMGTRLVCEEVTHFYQDGPSLQQAASEPGKPAVPSAVVPGMREEPRTAERQAPLPLPQSSAQPLPAAAIQR